MATRLLKRHDEQTRSKIQASQLINSLTNHVLGNNDLSSTQVKSAEILLRKSLPDLTSVEMTVDVEYTVASATPKTAEEWQSESAGLLSPAPKQA